MGLSADTAGGADRSARRARLLVAIGGGLALFVGGEVAFRAHPAWLRAWADVGWTAISLVAALRCLRAAGMRERPHQRRAWRWMASGCVAWLCGMIAWSFYELALGVVTPFPTVAEVGFLATPLFWAGGFLWLRADAPSRQLTRKQIGDLGVVLSTLAIVSALVLYAPASEHAEEPLYIAAALGYPVLHLGSFAFGLTTLWQHAQRGRRRIVAVLLAASAVLAGVTTFYAVSLLTRTYEAGDALDVFWIASFALVIWATYEEEWRAQDGAETAVERVRAADLMVTPVAIGGIALAIALFHERLRPELAGVLAVGGAIFAASLALREWGVHRIERAIRDAAQLEAQRHQRLLESAPLGIARVDARGRVVQSNRRFAAMLEGRPSDLVAPAWEDVGLAPLVRRALAQRERAISETPLRLGELVLRVSVSPEGGAGSGALVLALDASEEQRLQSELLQSQKMQAVGTLAGGIAHDFNNLLSGMIASVTVLRKHGAGPDSGVFLDHMEQSMWRAAELSQRLLSLSRRRDPVATVVDVGAVVERVSALLARSVDETIAVRTQLPAERVAIEGDAGQLEQALLNLGINARDAMRPRGGDLRFAVALERRGSGAQVVVRVSDGGTGIAPEVRERIFEPFFTTKDAGEGTGLGLSMVYAFVRDHGGTIDVESEAGRGTTFTLRLPSAGVAPADAPAASPDREPPRGTETILVVDDRDTALFALKTILGELGYTVVVASNGVEALAEIERHKSAIDLVITDAMMRRMGGRELLATMRRRGIATEVVLATGHDREGHLGVQGFAAVLRKPFDPAQTARVVRRVLEGELCGRAHGAGAPAAAEDADPTIEEEAYRSTKSSSLP